MSYAGGGVQYVSSVPAAKVAAGRFFTAGTGRMTLAAAGNVRAIVRNPAASGKTVALARISVFTTATAYATLWINPTTGVPGAGSRFRMNAIVGGGVAPVAEVNSDTDLTVAMGGGTDTGIVFGTPAGNRMSLDLPPFILAPGVSLGINVPFAGAGDATMSVYWWED